MIVTAAPPRARAPSRARAAILAAAALLAAALLAPPAALAARHAEDRLPTPVKRALLRNRLPPAGLSVWVQDVSAREPLLAVEPDAARNPASVMKLVTTLAGLEILGPGYQWTTRVLVDGPVDERGRLHGNLYLEGGGDPYLVTESFWLLLRAIREKGIQRIGGDIVVDDSYFDVGNLDPGAFDGHPYRDYNATPEAFLLNFKATRFTFRPDPGRKRILIMADPPSDGLRIDNALHLTEGRCRGRDYKIRMDVDHSVPGNAVRFSGDYPASCGSFELDRSVFDSVPYVYAAFKSLWAEMGGTVEGKGRAGTTPRDARTVVTWRSRPLSELIRSINKYSNNVMTRQLLLTLGAEGGGAPGTVAKGRQAIEEWLTAKHIDAKGLHIDNGSGLSRHARLTARMLASLLLDAYAGPYMPEFVSSMPLSAIDGTLRKRFHKSPLAGQMHMKTGLLDGVRALAGYMLSEQGKTYAVVVLHNHPGVQWGTGNAVQDALVKWLYRQ